MQITIDTPYVTPTEFARRAGLTERSVRHKIDQGLFLVKEKQPGEKGTVFINMVYMAMEAADQAERVRAVKNKKKAGEM
ncbi:hypothetical protein [Pseudomonas proteolytica]|uniref:hypothetical protein n=1 Tax=Pseudomonas proteolytica TaxID=219574 RepID=UPI00089BCD0B|nr:hypothetical protein [Pseudomonas proteolytica]KAA8697146.1 hypothetical protein F4W61_26915 [Pseudomonas proteolytica]NMZ04747.1 hypothetical protein [Pseudomonas proteolytica]TWR73511.1 hypothetical protein FIV38_27685 [Pseudomonas proteolytica]SED38476.1 hypothetical protein SAMN04490200_1222 [Pseudomonas proteolytica]SEE58327.1 hypothetical protein SAMN04490200_4579 [Pseudomonas proteolytica]